MTRMWIHGFIAVGAICLTTIQAAAQDPGDITEGRVCCEQVPGDTSVLDCSVEDSMATCMDGGGVPIPEGICCTVEPLVAGDPVLSGCLGQDCYTLTQGTPGVGICASGGWTCVDGALACVGQTGPIPETCNGIDDDCNGTTDDGFGVGDPCGGNGSVGTCRPGELVCTADGSGTECVNEVMPQPETCDNRDNDCDGTVDENLQRGCTTVNGRPGSQTCNAGVWGTCNP